MTSQQSIWDNWNRDGGPRYPHGKVVQFLFRRFPDVGKRTKVDVLDLGCGSGVHMVFLGQEGFRPHGRDISPVAIENTRAVMKKKGLTAESLQTASVDALDCPNCCFDIVISIGVLECAGVEKLGPAISEVCRVLRPGGEALLLFASDKDLRCSESNHLKLHGFTDDEVKAAVRPVLKNLERVCFDRYITTYDNKAREQNEHLITLTKSMKDG